MTKVPKKTIPCYRKIKALAGGSLYRMNAPSADCYAFFVEDGSERHLDGTKGITGDWQGGWDWSNGVVDRRATHIIMLDSGDLYRLEEKDYSLKI